MVRVSNLLTAAVTLASFLPHRFLISANVRCRQWNHPSSVLGRSHNMLMRKSGIFHDRFSVHADVENSSRIGLIILLPKIQQLREYGSLVSPHLHMILLSGVPVSLGRVTIEMQPRRPFPGSLHRCLRLGNHQIMGERAVILTKIDLSVVWQTREMSL